jgi:uncharacterized membrane protein
VDKMLIVVFESERRAYEGSRALEELHAEGSITLYGRAVIAKGADGTVTVQETADQGPLGTAVGLVTGGLVGLLGGPVGAAVGAAAGTIGGTSYDAATAVVGADFLDEAARSLAPGRWAVVAEVEEEWITPLDTRMEALDGTVLRRARGEIVDAWIARDVAALEAEIAALEAEEARASAEATAKLQATVDAARAKLQATRDTARVRAEARRREADAKVAALQAQAATARDERKQQIDRWMTDVRARVEEQTNRIKQAVG